MPYPERDIRSMIAELRATRGRVRELIRERELASSRKLTQLRRVRVLKKQAEWKREGGFDRIVIIAKMCGQTF